MHVRSSLLQLHSVPTWFPLFYDHKNYPTLTSRRLSSKSELAEHHGYLHHGYLVVGWRN